MSKKQNPQDDDLSDDDDFSSSEDEQEPLSANSMLNFKNDEARVVKKFTESLK